MYCVFYNQEIFYRQQTRKVVARYRMDIKHKKLIKLKSLFEWWMEFTLQRHIIFSLKKKNSFHYFNKLNYIYVIYTSYSNILYNYSTIIYIYLRCNLNIHINLIHHLLVWFCLIYLYIQ